tara:strand:+ start:4488 stop:5504 length:1017 start_codon:yes stop_codon:yes gene_type:complete
MSKVIEKYFIPYSLCQTMFYKKSIPKSSKTQKPQFSIKSIDYSLLLNTKLTLKSLLPLKKKYKIKGTYKKEELSYILYNTLRLYHYKNIIVKSFRNYKMKCYKILQGPINLNNVVNSECFETLEPISEHPTIDYIGIKENEYNYIFIIKSLKNIVKKYKKDAFNPYTREVISDDTIIRLKELTRLRKLFKIGSRVIAEPVCTIKPLEQQLDDLFYDLNNLGHLVDSNWIKELPKDRLIKYIYELADIWDYRANLNRETKLNIYSRLNPFFDIRMQRLVFESSDNLKHFIVKIIKRLISSDDVSYSSLGAFYALGALTLVNGNAAQALPWLFQSFFHSG